MSVQGVSSGVVLEEPAWQLVDRSLEKIKALVEQAGQEPSRQQELLEPSISDA